MTVLFFESLNTHLHICLTDTLRNMRAVLRLLLHNYRHLSLLMENPTSTTIFGV